MEETFDQQGQTKAKKPGLSLDILWFLVILAGFLFFTSLVPLPPHDFWWHLKIGEYIFTNHLVPTTNMYAWTLPASQPFFYAAWFAELLFYVFYRLGGLPILIFLRTFLIGVSVVLIAIESHRRSTSWRITALVVALLALMITNNLIVRTQIWAWVPFVASYIVLQRYTEGKVSWHWLLVCPIGMILWVNVHGSYILGLILLGAYFVGEALRKLFRQEGALSWRQLGWIGGSGLLTGLALLINPHFTDIIGYTINLPHNPVSLIIMEWESPTPQGIANTFFYVSILVFILTLALSKYRLTVTEIILMLGFIWMAWSGQRFVIWYGMVATPILARLIKDLPIKQFTFVPQRNWLNLALAVVFFIPVLAVQPWFVEHMPLPQTYWQQVIRGSPAGPLLGTETPVAAAEYLKAHPGGHLFNEMGYGSYLIWAVPNQGDFVDPRVELFPYDQWMDYIEVDNGRDYNQILSRYGVDRILSDKKLEPELSSALAKDPLWKLEYEDEYSQIWTKLPVPRGINH